MGKEEMARRAQRVKNAYEGEVQALLTDAQKVRYAEIQAQARAQAETKVRAQAGSKAESPPLADQLGLNERQRARLEAIQAKYRELSKKVAEEGKAHGLSQEEMAQRSLRLRNAYDKDVMSILTDEQKAKYQGMKAGGEQRTSAGQ